MVYGRRTNRRASGKGDGMEMAPAKLPPARVAGFETPSANWTATPPTVPGWYWWRPGKDWRESRMVQVVKEERELAAEAGGAFVAIRRWAGEWWSEPIQEPPK